MGCFLGCFGGDKDHERRKKRIDRPDPTRRRNRVQNVAEKSYLTSEVRVEQENVVQLEQSVTPTTSAKVVPEFIKNPDSVEQRTPSPKKRVTFNANVTTYEPVPDHDIVDEKEKLEGFKTMVQSNKESSISSSVDSYPPNRRYHNGRDSDDEAAYGDSGLDDLEDEDFEVSDEDDDIRNAYEVWSESFLTASAESSTGDMSQKSSIQNLVVTSPMLLAEAKVPGSRANARDNSGSINAVRVPVENITQLKAAMLNEVHLMKLQKENLESNIQATHTSSSQEQPFSHLPFTTMKKNRGQEVDASLSSWLTPPEVEKSKKASFSGLDSSPSSGTNSDGHSSRRCFEDRPILGALTVEELRQISASSPLKKSPGKSPDEVPIIGSVGSYWSGDSGSAKHSVSPVSFNGIPNTTSKYREDQRVNWHSTPFESRLDRVLG